MANEQYRICQTTGLRVYQSTENLIKANAVVAVVFLAIGGLFGLSVALTRWKAVHLLPADWFYLALTAHGLDALVVELDGVVGERRRRVVPDRAGDLAGGVPGGARGELRLLDEQRVGAALSCEMPQRRRAVDASADDDDPGPIPHVFAPVWSRPVPVVRPNFTDE